MATVAVQGQQDPNGSCDPVVIPIGVVGLALAIKMPAMPTMASGIPHKVHSWGLLSAELGAHAHTEADTCCITLSASEVKAVALAESAREITMASPVTPS